MVLGQRYHPIEAFPAQCTNEPFAERIRLRAPHWCCDDLEVEVRERRIESGGEDSVVVVEDEPVGMVLYGIAGAVAGASRRRLDSPSR